MKIKKFLKVICLLLVTVLLFFVTSAVKTEATANNEVPVELRGVWVATVSNIDIARQTSAGELQQKAYKEKLMTIIERAEYYGMNAIFFQIRPANDAFYESQYNAWSEFLVARGVNPGWDMLTWFIDECHAHGLEFHAWLNPYRVSASNIVDLTKMTQEEINNIKLSFRNQAIAAQGNIDNPVVNGTEEEFLTAVVGGKEGKLILNPARQTTIDHIANTIQEIIDNYDVDGIHFDDYFYPSGGIEKGVENDDYAEYVDNGGQLAIADWRRDNVNRMVERVHDIVSLHNETSEHYVAFGISPAAVWAPSSEKCSDSRGQDGGMNVICASYSSYNDLYADTRLWVRNEWLDYILPQNYYNFGDEYKEIASWWSKEVLNTSVKLYIGTPLYRVSEFKDSQLIKKQFDYIEQTTITRNNVSGFVLFSFRNLSSSDPYLSPANQTLYLTWKAGALSPTYKHYDCDLSIDDLQTEVYKVGNKYYVRFNQLADANGYVVSAIKKTVEGVDFNESITAKIYNPTKDLEPLIYEITESGINLNNFYLRLFDKNNNEVGYLKLDFENAVENPGATVVPHYDSEKEYNVGDTINFTFDIASRFDLPLFVLFEASQDGEKYQERYILTPNEDGVYEYNYSPFMDGYVYFRITADDGDKPTTIDLGSIKVGNPTEPIGPNPGGNTPSPSTNSCSFGLISISILSFLSLSIIFIKKGRN